MQIEKRAVAKLKAAPYNPRKDLKPGDAEYEKLKRSIQEFGYVEPVNFIRGVDMDYIGNSNSGGVSAPSGGTWACLPSVPRLLLPNRFPCPLIDLIP